MIRFIGFLARNKVILTGTLLVFLLWTLDVVIDGGLYSTETFMDELLHPSTLEIYHRGLIIFLVIIFTAYTHFTLKKLTESENKIHSLSQKLILSQEKERKHIAHELHDGLGQSLTHINITAALIAQHSGEKETIRRADEICQSTQYIFNGFRNILNTIDPHLIDKLGLVTSIESLIENWQKHCDLNYTFNHSGKLNELPYLVCISVYRIILECLINTSRHAEASELDISLSVMPGAEEKESDTLLLEVQDNGRGTDLRALNSTGMGLIDIDERVQALHGTCEFNSAPGKGMHVKIQISLSEST